MQQKWKEVCNLHKSWLEMRKIFNFGLFFGAVSIYVICKFLGGGIFKRKAKSDPWSRLRTDGRTKTQTTPLSLHEQIRSVRQLCCGPHWPETDKWRVTHNYTRASNDDWWPGNDMEGIIRGSIEAAYHNLSWQTDGDHKKKNQQR